MVWSKSYTNFCMVWYGTACNLYGMVWVYAILLWEFLLILTENPKGVLSILNYFSKFRVITDFKLGPIILQKKWAAKFRGPYHTIPYTSMPYTCMPYLCMVWHGLLHTILAYGMVWPVIHVHTSVWRPCLIFCCRCFVQKTQRRLGRTWNRTTHCHTWTGNELINCQSHKKEKNEKKKSTSKFENRVLKSIYKFQNRF